MDQQPLPPPAQARPVVVTTVAVLLFIGGAFAILGGMIAVFGGGFLVAVGGTGALILFGIVWLGVGVVEIWAGSGILKMREQARMVAIVIAGASAVLTIINIASGAGAGVLGLAIDGFVIWALVTNKQLFS